MNLVFLALCINLKWFAYGELKVLNENQRCTIYVQTQIKVNAPKCKFSNNEWLPHGKPHDFLKFRWNYCHSITVKKALAEQENMFLTLKKS